MDTSSLAAPVQGVAQAHASVATGYPAAQSAPGYEYGLPVVDGVPQAGSVAVPVRGGGRSCACGHMRLDANHTQRATGLAGHVSPGAWARAVQLVNEELRRSGLSGWGVALPPVAGIAAIALVSYALSVCLGNNNLGVAVGLRLLPAFLFVGLFQFVTSRARKRLVAGILQLSGQELAPLGLSASFVWSTGRHTPHQVIFIAAIPLAAAVHHATAAPTESDGSGSSIDELGDSLRDKDAPARDEEAP